MIYTDKRKSIKYIGTQYLFAFVFCKIALNKKYLI